MSLKVTYFAQDKDEYTCAPVCLRMAMSYLEGKRLNKDRYQEILDVAMDGNPNKVIGTSKKQLQFTIRKLGYKSKVIVGVGQLIKAVGRNHPIIVSCRMTDRSKRISHYILIKGMDDNYIYINNPYSRTPSKVLIEDFLSNNQEISWGNSQWGVGIYKSL